MNKLPADPESLNNDRATWAAAALDAFIDTTGVDPGEDAVSDLIADLHHWADRNGVDFDLMITRAASAYIEETSEL